MIPIITNSINILKIDFSSSVLDFSFIPQYQSGYYHIQCEKLLFEVLVA